MRRIPVNGIGRDVNTYISPTATHYTNLTSMGYVCDPPSCDPTESYGGKLTPSISTANSPALQNTKFAPDSVKSSPISWGDDHGCRLGTHSVGVLGGGRPGGPSGWLGGPVDIERPGGHPNLPGGPTGVFLDIFKYRVD